jgi:hypothetical protein
VEEDSDSQVTTSDVERALTDWSIASQDAGIGSSTSLSSVDNEELDGGGDPLDFLRSVFPDEDSAFLKHRLQADNGDVGVSRRPPFASTVFTDTAPFAFQRVVDFLLSRDYPPEKLIPGVANSDSASDGGSQVPMRTPKNRKNNNKRGAKQTISLTDVRRRTLRSSKTAEPPEASSSSTLSSAAASDDVSDDTRNKWVALDSNALYLARLLHVSPGRVTTYFHRSGSSLTVALDRLLDELERERPYDSLEAGDVLLVELHSVFPDKPVDLLRRLLCATKGVVEDSIDLLWKLEDVVRREGMPLAHSLTTVVRRPPVQPTTTTAGTFSRESDWKSIPLRHSPTTDQRIKAEANMSAEECASIAVEFRNKRDEAYRTAVRHYKSSTGGNGTRGTAFHYAEVGREHDQKRRHWEMRAATALVKKRRWVGARFSCSRREIVGLTNEGGKALRMKELLTSIR